MDRKTKLLLANLLFWLHFAIVTVWFGSFLLPPLAWPGKIVFQFYLTIIVIGHQILWGLFLMRWTHKFRMVCILTTPMQLLRGQKIDDPQNYDQAWLKELIGKNGIKIPHRFSSSITFFVLFLAIYQFIFIR